MGLILNLFVTLTLVTTIQGLDTCNVDLMRFYGLTPVKYPENHEMKLCKNVSQNCCSIEDELRIYNLWYKFSHVRINQFADDLFSGYDNLLSYHEDFVRADVDLIKVKYRKPIMNTKRVKICNQNTIQSVDSNFIKPNEHPGFNIFGRKLQEEEIKDILTINENKNDILPTSNVLNQNNNGLENKELNDSKLNVEKLNDDNNLENNNNPIEILSLELDDNKDRKLLNTTRPLLNQPKCHYVNKPTTKDITATNHKKSDFCYTIRAKLTNFPISELREYITTIRSDFLRLSEIKKTFYCNLCDAKRQMKINIKSGSIEFNTSFCKRLITDFKDYIRFQNIILIEYIDLILQYIRCYQTPAKEEEFPNPGFLSTYQSNFDVIHNCFDKINQPDFISSCRYLCQQYSYTTFSRFFDGNPELLDRVLMTIAGFFRKLKANQDLTITNSKFMNNFNNLDAVDLLTSESTPVNSISEAVTTYGVSGDFNAKSAINNGKVKLHKKIRINRNKTLNYRKISSNRFHRKLKLVSSEATKLSLLNLDKNKSDAKLSEEVTSSVYSSKEPVSLLSNYKSVFSDDPNCLDPFEVHNKTNFNISQRALIRSHQRKLLSTNRHNETIQPEVIKDYFSTNKKQIKNFSGDMDLKFEQFDDVANEPQFHNNGQLVF